MTIFILPSDNPIQRKLLVQTALRVTDLAPGSTYSLEAILGSEFWDTTDESHHSLGRHYAKLVEKARVPFVEAGFTGDRHNRYRFTGWEYSAPGSPLNSTTPSPNVLQ